MVRIMKLAYSRYEFRTSVKMNSPAGPSPARHDRDKHHVRQLHWARRYSQYVIVISVSTVSGFSFEFFLPIPAPADGLLPGHSPVLPTQEQPPDTGAASRHRNSLPIAGWAAEQQQRIAAAEGQLSGEWGQRLRTR